MKKPSEMTALEKTQLAVYYARKSYLSYVILSHHGKWIPGRLHRYICQNVQEFIEKPTPYPYLILILSVPPQHGKSQSITETLPSWYLGKYPDKRVIEISYNDDFAGKFGRRNKAKIGEFGKPLFGIELEKSGDREFEIKEHIGGMKSCGVMSGITGSPGDLIIIDDPIKNRQEADSEAYRKRLEEEWQNSIKTRTQAGSKIILIQTRWHENDLAGFLIKTEKHVKVINIPCEAEENDVLGREVGEALAPEIGKGNDWLKHFKESYKDGMRAWNALFQGRPTSQEGNILKREWWRYYAELPKMDIVIISVDATFKDNKDNDYVSIQAWGKNRANMFLIDAVKRRMDFPATLKAILEFKGNHPEASAIYIEDKANGPAIISVLHDKIPGIIAVNPNGSKIARVNAVSPFIESGNVYLPKGLSFTDDFVEECAAFPNGANDDQVDAASQALNKLIYIHSNIAEDEEEQMFHVKKKSGEPLGKGEKQNVI